MNFKNFLRNEPAPPAASTPSKAPPADPKKAIIGRWQEPGSTETTEFRADGKVTEKLADGGTISGKYSFSDGARVKMKFDGAMASLGELSFPVKISGDTLEMTGPDGKAARYQRVK